MPEITQGVANVLKKMVIDTELSAAKLNKHQEVDDFEAYLDLIDNIRSEKDYDWMSDINIPEFTAHLLTQISMDVDQYFSTRDFVEVYLNDSSPEAKANASASKECTNRTLNRRKLYHFNKFVRGKMVAFLVGNVWAKAEWVQDVKNYAPGEIEDDESVSRDPEDREQGSYLLRKDYFNYEILDNRNVFTDNTYAYSAQEKEFIIIRDEMTLHELIDAEESMGLINLDELKQKYGDVVSSNTETETARETYNYDGDYTSMSSLSQKFDIFERHGKFWCTVEEDDEFGNPTYVKPGIDEFGNKVYGAELHELIITFAVADGKHHLIRFQPTPYVDSEGYPYRGLIRGVQYIHPVDDKGFGDGKSARELQIAINDTFNMSNDRVILATMPIFKARRMSMEDNASITLQPLSVVELNDPQDLQELEIEPDTHGAMQQLGVLSTKMQEVDSIYPPTMGNMPAHASTTATAVAGADRSTNIRSNFKALSFENTFLTELYWMINQMTAQFAYPETAEKLLGDKKRDFDPTKDYFYKPLSQSIESEQSKDVKINRYLQLLNMIMQSPNPKAADLANYIIFRIATLMGDEYDNLEGVALQSGAPVSGKTDIPAIEGPQASNQSGLTQSAGEQMVREVASE